MALWPVSRQSLAPLPWWRTSAQPPYANLVASEETAIVVGRAPWEIGGTLTVPHGLRPIPAVVLISGSEYSDRDGTSGANKGLRAFVRGLTSHGMATAAPIDPHDSFRRQPDFTVDDEFVDDALAVPGNVSITGVGTGTGHNLGVTAAGQMVVVTARVISGTFTNLALDIQQSSDDGSTDPYANVNGLAFTFSEPGVSRKTISAATEAWKCVRVSAFAGTSAQLLVTIGVLQGA